MSGAIPTDGTPYMPSNGTEGEIFMGRWCEQCSKDRFDEGGDSCDIMLLALSGEQPEWWCYQAGLPACKAFEEKRDEPEQDVIPVSPGQLSLLPGGE